MWCGVTSEIHRKKRKRRERSQSKVNENQRKAEDEERILSVKLRETKMKEHMQRDQKEWTKEEGFDYHLVDNRKIIKSKNDWKYDQRHESCRNTHRFTAQPPRERACVHLFMFLFIYFSLSSSSEPPRGFTHIWRSHLRLGKCRFTDKANYTVAIYQR